MALRIWARQKWSFEWLMNKIPLKRQEQFFTEYRNIYERNIKADLTNITNLTDHHIGNLTPTQYNTRAKLGVGVNIGAN